MRRELREWGWMALGFSACFIIAGIGVVLWGNHIERRIDRVVVDRHRDHRELRRVVAALGGAREVQANSKEVQNLEDGATGRSAPQAKQPSKGTKGGSLSPPASEPKPTKPPPQAESPPQKADTGADIAPAGNETTARIPPEEVEQDRGEKASLAKPVLEDVGVTVEEAGEVVDQATCTVDAVLGTGLCVER